MTVRTIPYERKYREALLNLMFYSRRTHAHLDWYRPGQWLEDGGNIIEIAQQDDRLTGFLGLAAPLHAASWIRLAAISNGFDPGAVLSTLWKAAAQHLTDADVHTVAVLVINRWLAQHLPLLGFHYQEDVVTLYRSSGSLPSLPADSPVQIRSGYIEDLPQIVRVDHEAFRPPWQMTMEELRMSQRQAASCTLAELDGEVIGYQISTRHHTNGHLARLAVLPGVQGKGVGKCLLDDLIHRFYRRGVYTLTVNTQNSNVRSQRLYEQYGFRRNGFDLPVWMATL